MVYVISLQNVINFVNSGIQISAFLIIFGNVLTLVKSRLEGTFIINNSLNSDVIILCMFDKSYEILNEYET
jgi:uncharacterized membrane protein